MRNLDGRRWEKEASASEMEAFIFLFLLVSKCAQSRRLRKKKPNAMKAELQKEESFQTRPHSKEYFTPALFLVAILNLSLLHLSVKIWKSYLMHPWFHVSAPSACSKRENSIYFLTVIYTCTFFSLCVIRDERMCVITDNIFHSLSVFFYCCCVSLSVKRTALERHHCLDLRCQWRRGRSED